MSHSRIAQFAIAATAAAAVLSAAPARAQGQSIYTAQNGAQMQLPHTWQPNTTHQYQGHTYGVDASGQYHVLGSNGWWYPVLRH